MKRVAHLIVLSQTTFCTLKNRVPWFNKLIDKCDLLRVFVALAALSELCFGAIVRNGITIRNVEASILLGSSKMLDE